MSDSAGTPGPATNLIRSLVQLGGTVLAVVQTRVELLTTEISEDLERGIRIVLWAVVALLAGMFGAMLAAFAVVAWFWETHRMGAIVAVMLLFLGLAAGAGLVARRLLHQKPRLLDATRAELRQDVASLRGEP
jgi:uncharacterized membrane protein YqjE